MMKEILLFVFTILSVTMNAQEHTVSASANFGWAIPHGSGVSDADEDLNLDGGISYGVDLLYQLNPKLGVGIDYTAALLAGKGEFDIDVFEMRVIGLKGEYQLKDDGFRPYFGLTLGLGQLITPEVTITDGQGNSSTIGGQTSSTLGIKPEIGLIYNEYFIQGQWIVPGSYGIEGVFEGKKSAGSLIISIGYRRAISF